MSLRWHYGKELIYWRQYSIEANKSRPPLDQSYTEIKKLAFPAGVLHDGFLHSKDALKNHLKAFHDFQMCTKTAKGYKQSQRLTLSLAAWRLVRVHSQDDGWSPRSMMFCNSLRLCLSSQLVATRGKHLYSYLAV